MVMNVINEPCSMLLTTDQCPMANEPYKKPLELCTDTYYLI